MVTIKNRPLINALKKRKKKDGVSELAIVVGANSSYGTLRRLKNGEGQRLNLAAIGRIASCLGLEVEVRFVPMKAALQK